MGKMISIHEYELKLGTEASAFEHALQMAERQGLFKLPGLVGHHFIRGLKGNRTGKFAAIWVYENKAVWEKLWGTSDQVKNKREYPENWQKWERFLEPFLDRDPDEITYTAYEEV